MEAGLTMTPRSPSSPGSVRARPAAASRSTLKVPTRFTMTVLVTPSRLCADPSRATTRSAQPMPAQLIAMRSGRSFPLASSIAACTEASSVTSVRTKLVCPPSSSASAFPRSSCTSRIVTAAPLATSARVVASPRPEAPPVTTAATSKFFMQRTLDGHDRGPGGRPGHLTVLDRHTGHIRTDGQCCPDVWSAVRTTRGFSMFQKVTGDVQGPLEVKGALEIEGTVHGGAVVTGTLDLIGTCHGPIEVRLDGHADVEGVVHGDVHARGGKLRFRGIIDGRLGVKPEADVLFAAGSILNGRRLGGGGSRAPGEGPLSFNNPEGPPPPPPPGGGRWAPAA